MYKLRESQKNVLSQVDQALANGKKHIFIEAPTGTGKSIIGLELAKRYQNLFPETNAFLLTAEKILQKQYEETISEHGVEGAVSISGIDNYKCNLNGEKFSLGVCKTMGMGNSKALSSLSCATTCDYLQKWSQAQVSPVAIFNYSYYFIQMNYVLPKMKEYAPFQTRSLVVADEAHRLPDLLEEHFHATIDRSWVDLIKDCTEKLREQEVYIPFLGAKWGVLGKLISQQFGVPYKEKAAQLASLREIYKYMVDTREKISESKLQLQSKYKIDLGEGDANAVFSSWQTASEAIPPAVYHFNRVADSLKDFTCKLEDYITIIDDFGLDAMVISSEPGKRIFRIFNDQALFEKFYKPHGEHFVYMSATLQPEVLVKRFGLKEEEVEIIKVNSGWDPSLAPIHPLGIANFKHGNKEALPDSIGEIDRILSRHKGQRGIIHTTSYELAKQIKEHSKHSKRFLIYQGTTEKGALLDSLASSAKDAVILAPSMSEGVDLKNDLSRFQIICKISYPNISDALWMMRSRKQQYVYVATAVNTLIQQCGRSIRNESDYATTYILDSRFNKSFKRLSKYFTPEFKARIQAGTPVECK
jgi:Rad3-related DNA helicase